MSESHDTHDDAPTSRGSRIPAHWTGADLVAPITIGKPGWSRRYTRLIRVVDAMAFTCATGSILLWHETPLQAAAVVLSAVALAIAGRAIFYAWLRHLRRHGRAMSSLLAVGTTDGVAALVEHTRSAPELGWRVDGACTSTGAGVDGAPGIAGVPVVGDLDGVAAFALFNHVDAVAVGPTPGWTALRLQQLASDLDRSSTALLVDPQLVAPVGPRIRITGVLGLPLLRLDQPALTPAPRLLREAADRFVALLVLLLAAPVLIGCAIAVRYDGGPALQRQRRLGRGDQEFMLFTFRTTRVDNHLLTPVGRVLRRHCLDELPQLLNVLGGSMALVGPRPTVPQEVLPWSDGTAHRRSLLVKPGITGLWQIYSREHAGDEAEGVDLLYVEDWSLALDARILLRALRAAIGNFTR